MSSPKTPSGNVVYFNLRQQMLNERTANPTAPEQSLRSGPALLSAKTLATAAVCALGFTTSASAQTAAPADDSGAMPEVVVRGTQDRDYKPTTASSPKFTQPLRDTPQTVVVVPQAVIQDQGATNLRDVVRNVPGISIQAGEGGVPAGDNLSIRGFNARTDLFLDGVRDVGGYSRDSFNFEQVEVIKGPASTYSGRGSTGGSINIETKAPRQNPFYRAEAGFGTDNYKRFTIDINQPIFGFGASSSDKGIISGDKKAVVEPAEPSVAFRINAMWTEADVPDRSEVEGRRWGVAPSLSIGLGTPTTLTLSYMHLEQENVPDYGIPWVASNHTRLSEHRDKVSPVSFSNFYGILDRDYEIIRTNLGTLELKHAINDNHHIRFLSRYGQNVRDSMITAPRYRAPDSLDIRRQLQSRDQTDDIFANVVDYTGHFETGSVKHDLVAGVEYDIESQVNYLRVGPEAPIADLYHPNPFDPYRESVRRTGAKNEADINTLSAFVFDTMKFGEHWQLSGGLRYDYYDASLTQRDALGSTLDFGQTDSMLSWRGALAYKPVEEGTIYVAAGTSFNPSSEGLTSNFTVDNVHLEPEKSLTYEVGAKWEFFDKRLALNVAAFRTEKENARTQGVDPLDPVVLDGQQLVYGYEIGIAGNITDKWAIFAGYTYLDSEIESSAVPAEVGKEMPNTPHHTFSLWTTYQLPWKFEVGAGVQYVGDRYSAANNLRSAEGYWTFDAMLKYEVTKNCDLRFNVYNIADEEYIDRVGGGHFVPGPGRSATITASFKF